LRPEDEGEWDAQEWMRSSERDNVKGIIDKDSGTPFADARLFNAFYFDDFRVVVTSCRCCAAHAKFLLPLGSDSESFVLDACESEAQSLHEHPRLHTSHLYHYACSNETVSLRPSNCTV